MIPDSKLTAASLDVREVDLYLLRLLAPRLSSMFQHCRANSNVQILNDVSFAVLQCAILLFTNGITPGVQALGIKLRNNTHGAIFRLIVLSVALPALFGTLQQIGWAGGVADVEDDEQHQLARLRRKRITEFLNVAKKKILPIARLLVLLGWWSGRGVAATLPLVLSNVQYASIRRHSNLNVIYGHRRWIYEHILRCFQMLSPFLSFSELKAHVEYAAVFLVRHLIFFSQFCSTDQC